jgi:septum site-determining protein MinC
MDQDIPPVRLKGIGKCLWVTVDGTRSLNQLQGELARIFEPMKPNSSPTEVILDIPEGEGREDLLQRISQYLKSRFNLTVTEPLARPIKAGSQGHQKIKGLGMIGKHLSDTLLLAGRVRSGQTVSAKKHLIIMGDVNPGSELFASGDVLVMGSLCGSVRAGQPDNEEAIIWALDFRPILVKIGNLVAAGLPSGGNHSPEFAFVENGAIVVEDYLKANPFKRLTWPMIR